MADKSPARGKPTLKAERFLISTTWGPVKLEGSWVPTEPEVRASWDLYIELVTRISVVELKSDQGILREGLASLHSLFNKTREILHTYGPEVVRTSDNDTMSFGFLAIVVLNYVLRPFLTKWHPKLLDWEDRRNSISRVEHEQQWKDNLECRQELNNIRVILIEYADLLAKIAGVPPINLETNIPTSGIIPKTTLRDEELTFFDSPKEKD